ncbi:ATP-binding cassette domain-containing protein [Celerinatantimonas sp. YJH-8]|uniref:ATP-binding cassette domain-containing protein n=1 Tax=Celerinatantimonas sp. YJH-8 TaxID=3228714 RepID=UPI0038C646D3
MSQVQLQNIRLSISSEVNTLDLTLQAGQLVGLCGDIGSGPERLLEVLFGYRVPLSGKVRYNGEPIPHSEKALSAWRAKGVALVSDALPLIDILTVRENLLLALQVQGKNRRKALAQADEALATDQLLSIADRYPEQLNIIERTQVLLWRAYIAQPQLLLINQQINNLPAAIRGRWYQRFERLRQQRQCIVILFSSELLELCQQSDYLLAFDQGECIAHGQPQTLILRHDCQPLHRLLMKMNPLLAVNAKGLASMPSLCLKAQISAQAALSAMQSKQRSYAYLVQGSQLIGGLSLYQANRAVQQKATSLISYLDKLPTIEASVPLSEVLSEGVGRQRDLAVIDHKGRYLGQLRYKQILARLNEIFNPRHDYRISVEENQAEKEILPEAPSTLTSGAD